MRDINKTVRTFSFMITATLISKVLGLIRSQLIANYYGQGMEANAFTAASKLPFIFFEIALGAAVTSSFIPVFNDYLKTKDKKSAFRFANNFLNIAVLISIIIAAIGILFSNVLIKLTAAGLDSQTFNMAVKLTQIMFPMMIFAVLAFIFVGILQSFDEFNIPAAISIVSNIILILYFVLFNRSYGIYGLAVAMVVGWMFQMIIQIPFVKKKGYNYKFYINFKSKGIKKVVVIIIPILISTWVQPISDLVNNLLASYIIDGGIATLYYATTLYIIIVGVFTLAVGNLIFPSLSRSGASNEIDQFKKTVGSAVDAIVYFMIPLTIGLMILRVPIIQLLFERGKFDAKATMLTQGPLLFYALGMLGYGIREVMNKSFYALGDSKTPMNIAIIGILFNIVLSVVLSRFMGLEGLALSSSIAMTLIAILLVIRFQKKKFIIWTKSYLLTMFKVLISSLIMGAFALFMKEFMSNFVNVNTFIGLAINTVVTVILSVIVYFITTYLFRLKEPQMAIDMVKQKFMK